jgi:hypothetical protein
MIRYVIIAQQQGLGSAPPTRTDPPAAAFGALQVVLDVSSVSSFGSLSLPLDADTDSTDVAASGSPDAPPPRPEQAAEGSSSESSDSMRITIIAPSSTDHVGDVRFNLYN